MFSSLVFRCLVSLAVVGVVSEIGLGSFSAVAKSTVVRRAVEETTVGQEAGTTTVVADSAGEDDFGLKLQGQFASLMIGGGADNNETTSVEQNSSSVAVETPPSSPPPPSNIYSVPRRRLFPLAGLAAAPTTTPEFMKNAKLLKGWISDEMSDALWGFSPRPAGNPKCALHGQLYRNQLHNYTLWAMQMLDSTPRIPSGLLYGSMFQLGHFDECVDISVPEEDLDGKYCLATVHFAPDKNLYPNYYVPDLRTKYEKPDIHSPAWDVFKPSMDLSRRPRDFIHWGLCVPSSCTAADVEEALNELLVDSLAQHGLRVNVSLPDEKCYARRDEKPFSTGLFVVVAILAIVCLVVVHATWMDMFYYQSDRSHSKLWRRWLKPFSAYTNLSKLITANPNKEFSEFHYLKLFAIACVISGHRQMAMHGPTPNENPWWLEWSYTQFMIAFSVNGGVLVDTFFFLSGFLTCHYIYQELEKRKRLNLIAIIINRWIRIVPVYMFVMAVYGWVLPYTGDGPLWNSRIGLESDRCKQSWWINILFLNNYINVQDQCMTQSWYLACDMHFFILGSLLVYALWKWPKFGQFVMWLSFAVALFIPGYITYKHRYWGVVLHYNSLFIDPVSTEQFRVVYMPSHARAGPYLVGIIGAYFFTKLKKENYKFSVPVMIVGSAIGATLSVGTIMSGYIFYMRERPFELALNVIYGAIHRSVWSVGIVWFIVVEATTGYGILYNFMKHPFFTAFGRLTYCAYLVHMLPQLMHSGTTRVPIYLDFKRMIWYSMGDFVMTYALALVLNLLFEAPLERLQKKILKKMIRDSDKKKPPLEKKLNGNELTEVVGGGIDNHAMDKTDIPAS